jgi:hypothetical protein
MKSRLLIALFIFLIFPNLVHAAKKERLPYEDEEVIPLPLAYTHLLPSTSVIPGGSFVIGTTLGYGFFDVFEITTNLYLDIASVFNISGKVHLIQNDEFAVAAFVSYESQPIKTLSATPPATVTNTYSSLQPGAVISYYILQDLTGHTGFTYTSRNPALSKSDMQPKDGFVQGNFVNQEFTYGLARNVAVSLGTSYDLTYDVFGAGASIHLSGLQLGAHYFFNVGVDSFLPILGFSYALN